MTDPLNITQILNSTRDASAYNPVVVSGWEAPAVAALTLAGLILVIVYGISRVLNNEKMKAWAISEAGQFVASGLMIGTLGVIVSVLAAISLAVSGDSNVFQFGINYLDGLENKVTALMALIFSASMLIGAVKSITVQVIVGITPLAGLDGIFKVLSDQYSQLFVLMTFAEIQIAILYFCKATMLQLFLPVGVVLRTFPFTRAVGGFIMAFAIGMAIVFPLTFVLDSHALSQLHTERDNYIADTTQILTENANLASQNIDSPDKVWTFISSKASLFSFETLGKLGATIQWGISNLVVSIILLPLINFIITILFILQLSTVLGSEVNFSFIKKL